MTEAQQRKCLVNWNENQVVMHAECWKKFCDQKVTPKELALRESALETAEFYDDKKKLKKSVSNYICSAPDKLTLARF